MDALYSLFPLTLLGLGIYFIRKRFIRIRYSDKIEKEIDRLNKKVVVSLATFDKPDKELEEDIIFSIEQNLKWNEGEKEIEFIDKLEPPFKSLYASSFYDDYVYDGGFELLNAEFGLNGLQKMKECAEELYAHEQSRLIDEALKRIPTLSNEPTTELSDLDVKYTSLGGMYSQRIDFIKSNKQLFLTQK